MKSSRCRDLCLRRKAFMFGTADTAVVAGDGNADGWHNKNDVGL